MMGIGPGGWRAWSVDVVRKPLNHPQWLSVSALFAVYRIPRTVTIVSWQCVHLGPIFQVQHGYMV